MENQKENELQQVKEEAAAAKQELSSYREKAEKLQQELAVRTKLLMWYLKQTPVQDLCRYAGCRASQLCAGYATKKSSGTELILQTKPFTSCQST